jgi:hypothetical protein
MVEEGYGVNVVINLSEYISAACDFHPTVNSSTSMARLMNSLKGRGPKCTLIVFIDDATNALIALRFAPAETTGLHGNPSGLP